MIFRWRVLLKFWCSSLLNVNLTLLYPQFFRAVSYANFDSSKTCLQDELLFNLLLIDVGNCFITWGGWFDDVLMYSKESLGFLYGRYVPFCKLKVTSRKSTIFRFVWISILNPTSLKTYMIFFLKRSIFCLLTLRNKINQDYTIYLYLYDKTELYQVHQKKVYKFDWILWETGYRF